MSFRVEYKRATSGPAMFQRHVRFQVDVATISTTTSTANKQQSSIGGGNDDNNIIDQQQQQQQPYHHHYQQQQQQNQQLSQQPHHLFAITFTLLSGNIRRFRRVCEHIQAQVCTRRGAAVAPPPSPRAQRKFVGELSESSSCGSDSSELHANATTTRQLHLFQLESSDLESECSVFDVRTATRGGDNCAGANATRRRSSTTATNNNNTTTESAMEQQSTIGLNNSNGGGGGGSGGASGLSGGGVAKAVRSSSENSDPYERRTKAKPCATTMSGGSIA